MDGVTARAKLWLRSERAIGVGNSIRLNSAQAQSRPGGSLALESPTQVESPPRDESLLPAASDAPITSPPLAPAQRHERLEALAAEVKNCQRCRLCEDRTQTVFGEGDVNAAIMFIG